MVKGVLFAVLIPFGQGPDEPAHVAATLLFARPMPLWPHGNQYTYENFDTDMHQAIFDLLEQERFWPLMREDRELSPFSIVPYPRDVSDLSYFASYVVGVRSHTSPLYFVLTGQLIRVFEIHTLWGQWLFLRLLGVALGLGVMGFTYLIAKTLIPEDNALALAAAICVGFLPQYSFLSAVVSPDTLLIFVATATLYVACRLIQAQRKRWWTCGLIVLSLLCMLTKRAGFASVLFAVIVLPVAFWKSLFAPKPRVTVGSHALRILGLFLGLPTALGIAVGVTAFTSPSLYDVVVGRIFEIVSQFWHRPLLLSLPDFFRFSAILFVSFWFTYGWMIYKMAVGWYGVFAGLSLIGGAGILRTLIRPERGISLPLVLLLVFFLGLYWLSAFALVVASQSVDVTQGRYLMPAVAAVGILLSLGVRGIVPRTGRQLALQLLSLCMIGLNGIAVFKYLLPIFYVE